MIRLAGSSEAQVKASRRTLAELIGREGLFLILIRDESEKTLPYRRLLAEMLEAEDLLEFEGERLFEWVVLESGDILSEGQVSDWFGVSNTVWGACLDEDGHLVRTGTFPTLGRLPFSQQPSNWQPEFSGRVRIIIPAAVASLQTGGGDA